MTQAPNPRGPLGQLLDDAKLASGKQWRTIESESGIPLSSIQSWISGRSEEPSLRGLLHLARYLRIPAEEITDAALEGYVPPLQAHVTNGAAKALSAASSSRAGRPAASPESFAEGAALAEEQKPVTRRRPRSKRQNLDPDGEAQ